MGFTAELIKGVEKYFKNVNHFKELRSRAPNEQLPYKYLILLSKIAITSTPFYRNKYKNKKW